MIEKSFTTDRGMIRYWISDAEERDRPELVNRLIEEFAERIISGKER